MLLCQLYKGGTLFIAVSPAHRTVLGTYYVLSKHLLKLKGFKEAKCEEETLKEKLVCGEDRNTGDMPREQWAIS